MFTSTTLKIDYDTICSYNISKMISKSEKPHTIGEELFLQAIEEILRNVVHHPLPSHIITSIPLSNNSVQRKIDEMADNTVETLCNIKTQQFGLQLDESTLCNIKTQQFGLQLDESILPSNESLFLGD